MKSLKEKAGIFKNILGLATDPVAVFLIQNNNIRFDSSNWTVLSRHRYCQALMKARRGQKVRLLPDELTCPAAASAFGFRNLPAGLVNGKGLVGFGITGASETGKRMFEGMTRLEKGSITEIALCPLELTPGIPDVVVIEGKPEQLMWILLADLNRDGGKRRMGNTAVLQATCVDSTITPFVKKQLNFSLGCYGCREATDMGSDETVLGFPGSLFDPIFSEIKRLNIKAIPNSRKKSVFHSLVSLNDDSKNKIEKDSPFDENK